eukprot:gene2690-2990_t
MMQKKSQQPIVCHGHSRPIVEVNYSGVTPDGYFLVSASKDGQPMLRSGTTGDWIGTFLGHKGAVWSCALDPTATLAATGSADFSAKVWDALTGAAVFVGPQDSLLVSISSDTSGISVWDVRAGQLVRTVPTEGAVSSIDLTHDGRWLTTTDKNTVRIWDTAALDKPCKEFTLKYPVEAASYCPAKNKFAAGGDDMWVHLHNAETGAELEVNKGHHGPVHTVRFGPEGKEFASGSEDGTIRICLILIQPNSAVSGLVPVMYIQAPYAHRIRIQNAPSLYELPDPPGYKPIFLYLLARHGSRWPTEQRLRQINSLQHVFKSADSARHPWMANWTSPMAGIEYLAGELHAEGEAEMAGLAARLRMRFPDLAMAQPYAPKRFPITATQRHDPILRFFDSCKGYREHKVRTLRWLVLLLEWLEDVRLYEVQGYGAAINYQIAAPLLADVATALVSAAAATSAGRTPLQLARLNFAHCETLTPLASLLGLFQPPDIEAQQMPPLPTDEDLQAATADAELKIIGFNLLAAERN